MSTRGSGETPEDAHATTAEVEEALSNLSDADSLRLVKTAKMWVRNRGLGRHDVDYRDLLSDAITKTLDGVRKWKPKSATLVYHLIRVMESDSSNEARKRKRSIEDRESPPESGGAEAEYADPAPGPDTVFEAKEYVELLYAAFEGDEIALQIMEGWTAGFKGPDICELYNMTSEQFDAGRKRLRRNASRLLEGGATNVGEGD